MTSLNLQTLSRIKTLRADASALAGFHDRYQEKFANDRNCDKKGYGFGTDERFAAFRVSTFFESHAGYYGNSSCSKILSVQSQDEVQRFVVKAISVHQKEIFATAARLMRAEAASLSDTAETEIEALRKLLAETREAVEAPASDEIPA